ncbi:MAG TPA: hypothetical protein VN031_00865 [Candidatus Microsaccharimonas sp.]|nr:hypothetical protein [Candidatus Microsaccharimonas sp.]
MIIEQSQWPYLDVSRTPLAQLGTARRINTTIERLQAVDRVMLDRGQDGLPIRERLGRRVLLGSAEYVADNSTRQLTIIGQGRFSPVTSLEVTPRSVLWMVLPASVDDWQETTAIDMIEQGIPRGFEAAARAAGAWATTAIRAAVERQYDVPDAAITQ